MAIDLKVPEVGESIKEVEIGEWLIKPGSAVEKDQNVVVIETDKVTVEIPAPEAGVLEEILVESGEVAAIGDVIARINPEGKASESADESDDSTSKKDKAKADQAKKSEKKAKESDSEKSDQADSKSPKKQVKVEAAESTGTPWSESDEKKEKSEGSSDDSDADDRRIMPAAQRLIDEYGLDPGDIDSTGPGDRMLKEDVQRFIEQAEESRKQSSDKKQADRSQRDQQQKRQRDTAADEPIESRDDEQVVKMTPMRRRIADRLVSIQQSAALLTTFNEIDMQAVMELRNDFKEAFADTHGVKLGFMSFFVKAACQALQEIPEVNAEIRGDKIVYKNHYDVGVAVSTEKGLLVPVLRNANQMSFAQIEMQINDLALRARSGKIELRELEGGTFTITNGGVFGSLLSTPILNPPQSGILGMHSIQDRPVALDGQVVIRPMMYTALTYDHRIVDGKGAVTFLRRIKELVESPTRLMLEV